MIKNTMLALVAAAGLVGVALPTYASDSLTSSFSSHDNGGYSTWDAQVDVAKLREKGINAVSAEDWNGYVRAFVSDESGKQTMKYFDRDTLAPVNL
ncbi:hypothetical protein N8A98_08850 [Devosia neptuniae]|jgi:hypothetical protein|uniref:PepSY domain-containing protein n=1 Tax=Devosia neptuniae TaxID=191302 RepID=A0ABY6CML8_9HYPH|nr:hypothetical protein [Devosia neptuniae]UXN71263.1 hypothetical protein N8A98_08850 [Devosia neptuniae]